MAFRNLVVFVYKLLAWNIVTARKTYIWWWIKLTEKNWTVGHDVSCTLKSYRIGIGSLWSQTNFKTMLDRKIALNPPAFFIVILTNQRRKLKVDDLYILTARQHQPLTCSCATSVTHKSTRHSQLAYLGCPLRFQAGFSFILHYNLIQLFLKHTWL